MQIEAMAGHLIRRLHQISTQVFGKHMLAAGTDLTPVQFAALDAIVAHPGIDQASIATKIAYDRATIGGVIDRLEQKGFVTRVVAQHDRRAREVRATQDGRDLYDRILPIVQDLQMDILFGLSPAERAEFQRIATKIVLLAE